MAYHHLNTLTIFPEKLAHNLDVLSKLQENIQPVTVLKSNAYGHGINILAPLLAHYDIPFVCVDSLYEAYELEKYGYKKDVLIMGYVDPRDIPRRKNFIYAVSDLEYGSALIHQYSRGRMHLFLDTGMHREGLQIEKREERGEQIIRLAPHIEWIMSHLSTPDNFEVTNVQLSDFQTSVDQLQSLGISPKYIHIFASGGLINAKNYTTPVGNIARTGLAFYGYGHPDLQPALRCTTRIIQIKHIQKGDAVGYEGTYHAENAMKIGVLPLGYNDGLDRRLSNIGVVGIGNQLCPIIGRVSMNLTTIDVSDIPDIREDQEVMIMSEDALSPLSLENQSKRAGMIPYDILVHMNREMYRTTIKKK